MSKHTTRVQQIESAALLIAISLAYFHAGGSWWLYILLLFAPDIFIAGYLFNSRVGAYVYNAGHSLVMPLIFLTVGLFTGHQILQFIGQIWLAHIGLDRMLGFGLKETTHFNHTHLGTIGKARS